MQKKKVESSALDNAVCKKECIKKKNEIVEQGDQR